MSLALKEHRGEKIRILLVQPKEGREIASYFFTFAMDEEIAVNAVNSSQNNINELFGDDDSASDDEISLESEEVTDFGSQTRSTLEEVGSLNCVDTPSISDGCSKLLYTKVRRLSKGASSFSPVLNHLNPPTLLSSPA